MITNIQKGSQYIKHLNQQHTFLRGKHWANKATDDVQKAGRSLRSSSKCCWFPKAVVVLYFIWPLHWKLHSMDTWNYYKMCYPTGNWKFLHFLLYLTVYILKHLQRQRAVGIKHFALLDWGFTSVKGEGNSILLLTQTPALTKEKSWPDRQTLQIISLATGIKQHGICIPAYLL